MGNSVYFPAGQVVQALFAEPEENVPDAHSVHMVPSPEAYPGPHEKHVVLPERLANCPGAQGQHEAKFDAPV